MGWTNMEEDKTNNKKEMETTSKILLSIIVCLVLIIILIIVMLLNIKMNAVILSIDGKEQADYNINKLVFDIEGITYINIEEFAKLVEYEYHKGEYKSFSNEEDKCYVTGKYETATFYLNDNKINKLPLDSEFEEEYRVNIVDKPTKMINDKMYATIEAISVAFNVAISKDENTLKIVTLDQLVKVDNNNVTRWGYTEITDQTFENKKALLYDRIIVKKEDGLYKIINRQNTKEIVPDKYTDIQFSESEQQFLVTNSLGQVGIIDLEGTIVVEPKYDSITIFDKEEKLYIVEKDTKFGIVKSGDIEIIAFKYDAIGSNITSVEINESSKKVNPVVTIEACNGIVVKKGDKYGVIDIKEKIIVPIQVDSIYSIENDENKLEYFMIYNGEELNIIEMLIEQGIIEDPSLEKNVQENENNEKQQNTNTIVEGNNTIITSSENVITNTALENVV